jgi:truncated hemoglobin YjbI
MSTPRRYRLKQEKARRRQREKYRQKIIKEQAEAQKYLQELQKAFDELGLPEEVADLIARKLKMQRKAIAKVFDVPSFWGMLYLL